MLAHVRLLEATRAPVRPVRGLRALRIAIESIPTAADVAYGNGPAALRVLGPTALPLFADEGAPLLPNQEARVGGSLFPFGARGIEMADGGCSAIIPIGRHRFRDGRRVTAADYVRGLTRLHAAPGAPARMYLRDVVGYLPAGRLWAAGPNPGLPGLIVDRDRLVIRLKRPNYLLPSILSCAAFSPAHPFDAWQSAGLYGVSYRTDNGLHLTPNPHGPALGTDELIFVPVDGRHDAVKRYEARLLDVTCDSTFPYEWVASFRNRPDFVAQPSHMMVSLRILNTRHPALASAAVRMAIARTIDRVDLCRRLGLLTTPISSFENAVPTGEPEQLADDLTVLAQGSGRFPTAQARHGLTLAYGDFYPSRAIAVAVANQLRSMVGPVEVRPASAMSGALRADVSLELVSPPFRDPLAHLVGEAHSPVFMAEPERWRSYLAAVHAYQAEPDPSSRATLLALASHVLAAHGHVIPLLRLPRLSLHRKRRARDDRSVFWA